MYELQLQLQFAIIFIINFAINFAIAIENTKYTLIHDIIVMFN